MKSQFSSPASNNRWLVAIMGTVLQLVLGTIYAWSYFQNPIVEATGWSNLEVARILSFAICFLGLSAAVGGVLLPKLGPRLLAVLGGLLYGLGWVIGGYALSINNLWLLYLGVGVVGGIGLGLGYVTPVATAAKWFPDKKGFITGMVVMGFGLGALLMSKVIGPYAVSLTTNAVSLTTNWATTFYLIGAILGVPGVIAGLFLKNPPTNFSPVHRHSTHSKARVNRTFYSAAECILSWRFAMMWFIFFCNITAGIMFIGFQSPMIQSLFVSRQVALSALTLASYGATLIAISSLFNGLGRFFWGGLSDKIGRITTFRIILASQIVVFVLLTFISSPILFGVMVCYILLCYGGGFGTAPSFVLTVFGTKVMSTVYGVLLTAWAMAGLVGPQIAAYLKDSFTSEIAASYTYGVGAVFLLIGLLVSLALSDKPFMKK